MRPRQFSYTPADDATDGFANDVTASAGVALTLAATAAGDGMAHLVIITPSGSVTGNYTLTGTDADGNSQTETLATDTVNAVTSTKYFKTLTSVLAPSGIGSETVDIGWTDDAVSPTWVPDFKQQFFSIGIGLDVSGTISVDVQHTFDDIFDADVAYSSRTWLDHASLAAKTSDADGNYAAGVRGIRLLINSVTAGGTVKVTYIQGSEG